MRETFMEIQYAVRYGDGEIDIFGPSLGEVETYVASAREGIASGQFDAEDYEPMSIIRRTVTVTREESDWQEAS